MVLINNLTIDEINAALLHLQRSSGEIVGGNKGRTINNISVSNSGGGGIDYQSVINSLKERLSQVETTNTEQQTQINEILLTLGNLADNGIQDFDYDENSGELTITTKDGEEYTVVIRSPTSTLTFDATTKKLTFTFNDDITEITLPYVASSEKGVANGVATLDSTGRIPYSQMPESAIGEVRTVNGQSGDVVLDGEDINYSSASGSPTLKDKIDTVEGYAKTQSDWGQTNTSAIDYIKNKPNLATVATSGSYNDLSNKPTIPAAQIQSDWTQTDSTKKDFIKNKIPIWITSGSADDNMSPIDSVTDGSMRPITSNAVFDAIVGQSGTRAEITIGEVAWIKVCSIENWSRGDVLELYFQNDWNTAGSSARKITIAKGTSDGGGGYASWVTVKEETSDPQILLSEIQICGANSISSTDKVFVYVKYNKTTSNTIRMAYKSVGFNPPTVYMTKETPSGYALNLNYALHDKGVYINGVNMTPSYFLTSSQVIDSFQAEIGGIYFIYYSRSVNTTHGISSGANVILEQYSSSNIAYIGFVKATATTITMLGIGNIIYYKRLA